MNKADISKEKIIEVSIELLQESRVTDLNMRTVAGKCNVSVGSIYNYFPDKSQLMLSVIEHVWTKAFSMELFQEDISMGFPVYIGKIYQKVYLAQKNYFNFFQIHRDLMDHSKKQLGKTNMMTYTNRIKAVICRSLEKDKKVKSIWSEDFTTDMMAEFVFQQMVSCLTSDQNNCDFLVKLLEKCLYGSET